MSRTFELHFQEGFFGQTVEISVDGEEVARFEARTRLQTGLARIEKLDLRSGQEMTIHIKELNLNESFRLEYAQIYVMVNLINERLIVRLTDRLPGYL